MAAVAVRPVTFEEYLLAEEGSQVRHELHDGRIIEMPGGSLQHAIVISNIVREVGIILTPPCLCLADSGKVASPSGGIYYPDSMIACPPLSKRSRTGIIDNPRVIFEVISPRTGAYDRGAKFDAYDSMASVEEIVLIEPMAVLIELYRRNSDGYWVRFPFFSLEGQLPLLQGELRVPLSAIYANVDFDAE